MSIVHEIRSWVRLKATEKKTRRRREFWKENGRPYEAREQQVQDHKMMESGVMQVKQKFNVKPMFMFIFFDKLDQN